MSEFSNPAELPDDASMGSASREEQHGSTNEDSSKSGGLDDALAREIEAAMSDMAPDDMAALTGDMLDGGAAGSAGRSGSALPRTRPWCRGSPAPP